MTTNTSNLTPIESKQPKPQAKFSIARTIDGFPLTIEGEGREANLKLIVDRLKTIGAEPPQALPSPAKAYGACPSPKPRND